MGHTRSVTRRNRVTSVIKHRYLIPAPVDWTSASALVVKTPIWTRYNPSTSMTHVACGSKLRSVVRSFMHPCPGDLVAIGCADVYYAQTVHAFSAGVK